MQILAQYSRKKTNCILWGLSSSYKPVSVLNHLQSQIKQRDLIHTVGKDSAIFLDDIQTQSRDDILTVIETLKLGDMNGSMLNLQDLSFEKFLNVRCLYCYKLASSEIGVYNDEDAIRKLSNMVHIFKLPPLTRDELEGIFEELFNHYMTACDQSIKSICSPLSRYFFDVYYAVCDYISKQSDDAGISELVCHTKQVKYILRSIASIASHKLLDRDGFISIFLHECFRLFSDSGMISEQTLSGILERLYPAQSLYEDYSKVRSQTGTVYIPHDETYTELPLDDVFNLLHAKPDIIQYDSMVHNVSRVLRTIKVDFSDRVTSNAVLIGPYGIGKLTAVNLAASTQMLAL